MSAILVALLIVFAGISFVLAICLMCAGVDWLMGNEGGE